MRNYLNKSHPKYCELSEDAIHKLNCLHLAMDCLKNRWGWLPAGSPDEDYKESCTMLEYEMQEVWGFPRDSMFHTHINHFIYDWVV